jgi:hypothetical protein
MWFLIKKFQVTVANEAKIDCTGLCPSLTIMIQGQLITADYFILPVAACPVVLGVQWLVTLGPMETDYKRLTMSFKKDGNLCVFQGVETIRTTSFDREGIQYYVRL